MFRGIYTSTNGMDATQTRIDTVSNNISNMNTVGFKRDVAIEMTQPNFPTVLASIRGMGAGVFAKTFEGRGAYFEQKNGEYLLVNDAGTIGLEFPGQIYQTKSAVLVVDKEGFLATREGHRLLGEKGPIQTNGQPLEIDKSGNIKVNGTVVDKLLRNNPVNSIGIIDSEKQGMSVITKFDQGELSTTGNTLDFAIQGTGFFISSSPDGLVYQRSGNFLKSEDGYLVNGLGQRIQGENGDILLTGSIVKVDVDGNIKQDGVITDKLKVVDFEDTRFLKKITGSSFIINPIYGNEIVEIPFKGEIIQGALESSNVSSIQEMVNMISYNRNFESSQKVIQAYDTIMGRAVNDIGRLA